MKSRASADLQGLIEFTFARSELLEQALTHSSYAREADTLRPAEAQRTPDNEQLEFLGDAVLSMITTAELFEKYPHFSEGELSKLRAHLVSERHLIRVAQQLNLGGYLRLGRGEEKSGGRNKTAVLVDALEAIFGAMYLDGGLDAARKLILKHVVHPELELIANSGTRLPNSDFKSALQEKLQASGLPQPSYNLVNEAGPEHNKTFTVEARLNLADDSGGSSFVGRSEGTTKKNAEQGAARQVLEHLASSPESVVIRPRTRNGSDRTDNGPSR